MTSGNTQWAWTSTVLTRRPLTTTSRRRTAGCAWASGAWSRPQPQNMTPAIAPAAPPRKSLRVVIWFLSFDGWLSRRGRRSDRIVAGDPSVPKGPFASSGHRRMTFDRPRRGLSLARLKNTWLKRNAHPQPRIIQGERHAPITPAMLSGLVSSPWWRLAASAPRKPARRPIRCPIRIVRSRTGARCRPAGPGARPAQSRSILTAPASGSPNDAGNPRPPSQVNPGGAVRLRRLRALTPSSSSMRRASS